MQEAARRALDLIPQVGEEFASGLGRAPLSLLDHYRTDGAEAVLLAAGSLAATARDAVDLLRDRGLAAGLVRLRVFRPFPVEAVRDLAREVWVIGVVDRSVSFGSGGPIATEVRAALHGTNASAQVGSYIAGLGGRDVTPGHLAAILEGLLAGDIPSERWTGTALGGR